MYGATNHLELEYDDQDDPARFQHLDKNDVQESTYQGFQISDTHKRLLNQPDVVALMEPGQIYSIAFHDKLILSDQI